MRLSPCALILIYHQALMFLSCNFTERQVAQTSQTAANRVVRELTGGLSILTLGGNIKGCLSQHSDPGNQCHSFSGCKITLIKGSSLFMYQLSPYHVGGALEWEDVVSDAEMCWWLFVVLLWLLWTCSVGIQQWGTMPCSLVLQEDVEQWWPAKLYGQPTKYISLIEYFLRLCHKWRYI